MSREFSGGKRNREASRDLKKRQKEDRLRRNRDLRARGFDPDLMDPAAGTGAPLPEVKLEDVVISVPSQSRKADFGPIKLFVGGLHTDTTAADLRRWFAPYGDVVDAIVVADRGTGRSRGFGFVSYRSPDAAEAATKALNGVDVDGQVIKVNRAEARPPRY
jgi:RNA recognition motif-containing protein